MWESTDYHIYTSFSSGVCGGGGALGHGTCLKFLIVSVCNVWCHYMLAR